MRVTFLPGSLKSAILVLIQFICVGITASTGKVIPENPILILLLIFSLFLALWSMVIMKFHFNVAPDLLPGTSLKTNGPYRFIRHPMYSSLLLLILVWTINYYTTFRLMVFIALFMDLALKIYFEEKILIDKLENYKEYKKHSKRIIPFIY